jgi:Tol biopolymer transport system component
MLALGSEDDKEAIIWIYDVASSGAPRRLTFEGHNRFPVWSHDSQYVAFQSDRDGDLAIYRQRADNNGIAERLTKASKGTAHIPESWSPDGSQLLYDETNEDTATLWSLAIADKHTAAVGAITSPKTTLHSASFSPDGRWLAYASRAGRTSSAIFVEPFPPTGAKHMVSKNQDDGHHPVWSPAGTELFFTPGSGTRVSTVRVTTRPAFTILSEETVLPRPFRNAAPLAIRPFDVTPDGQGFIGLVDPAAVSAGAAADRLRVVLNWVDDVKRRVPVP